MNKHRVANLIVSVVLVLSHFALPVESVSAQSVLNVACGDVSGLATTIISANDEVANPGPDTINLATGCIYELVEVNNNYSGWINGLPVVTTNITINGNGAVLERNQAAPRFRIFYMIPGSKLTLNDLTLQNSSPDNNGGAIYSWGGAIWSSTILYLGIIWPLVQAGQFGLMVVLL